MSRRSFPAVCALGLALCLSLPLSAAEGKGRGAAAPTLRARFILEKGTELVKGLPGFEANAFEALHGLYSLPARDGGLIEVWATRERLFLNRGEWAFRNSGAIRVAERDALSLVDQVDGSEWSVLVRWPAVFAVADRDAFLSLFLDRFSYFRSLAHQATDISFPAVLERP